jgi:hypothetical protein
MYQLNYLAIIRIQFYFHFFPLLNHNADISQLHPRTSEINKNEWQKPDYDNQTAHADLLINLNTQLVQHQRIRDLSDIADICMWE